MILQLKKKVIILVITIFLLFTTHIYSEILFESEQIESGWSIKIINNSDQLYKVMLISSNPDYLPEQGQLIIESGESARVNIQLTSITKPQLTEQSLMIRLLSNHPDNPELLSLGNNTSPAANNSDSANRVNEGILLEYYYTPTCRSCREFLANEIPRLEKKLNIIIRLKEINITAAAGLISMNKRLSDLESNENKLPIVIINNTVMAGDKVIKANLEKALSGNVTYIPSSQKGELDFSLLPIILAGLIDGINPCAFSTLLFLLSWLTLAGRVRKEILITGIFFTLAVFLTYYSVGLGAFAALQRSRSVPLISILLKYIMAFAMLILGIIHILDYIKILKGKAEEITLQLSKDRKKKIHSLIRGKVRQTSLFAGSLILGVLVTIYELGCTGQIYLPTLMYMVRMKKELSSFFLLALYNLGFIIPLLIIFFAAWKGMASEKLTSWFKGSLKRLKLMSAVFFLLMAILLIIF